MPEPLSRETLKSVYDRVAGWYDWQHAFFTLNSDQRGRGRGRLRTVHRGPALAVSCLRGRKTGA